VRLAALDLREDLRAGSGGSVMDTRILRFCVSSKFTGSHFSASSEVGVVTMSLRYTCRLHDTYQRRHLGDLCSDLVLRSLARYGAGLISRLWLRTPC